MARTAEEGALLRALEDVWTHLFMSTGMDRTAQDNWVKRAAALSSRLAKANGTEDLVQLAVNLEQDISEVRKALRAMARGESWSPGLEISAAQLLRAACLEAVTMLLKSPAGPVEGTEDAAAELICRCVCAADRLREALRATDSGAA